jgi:signal peptidase II
MRAAEGNPALILGVPRNRHFVFAVITGLTLGVDLMTKTVAFSKLGGPFVRGGWLLDGWLKFEFHTSLNRGALWGMGQGGSLYFAALSIAAFLGISYWLFVRGAAVSRWLTVALAFVSGGTLGNLYDRLGLHGVRWPGEASSAQAVRDFLHFQLGPLDWPIFNFADVFLVTGAIMLMIQSLFMADPMAAPATGRTSGNTLPAEERSADEPAGQSPSPYAVRRS